MGLLERQDSANYEPRPPAMTERQDSAQNLQVSYQMAQRPQVALMHGPASQGLHHCRPAEDVSDCACCLDVHGKTCSDVFHSAVKAVVLAGTGNG